MWGWSYKGFTKFQTKNIDAEYFYNIVWRDFARWVIFTGQLRNPWQTLAEPRLKITGLGSELGLELVKMHVAVYTYRVPKPWILQTRNTQEIHRKREPKDSTEVYEHINSWILQVINSRLQYKVSSLMKSFAKHKRTWISTRQWYCMHIWRSFWSTGNHLWHCLIANLHFTNVINNHHNNLCTWSCSLKKVTEKLYEVIKLWHPAAKQKSF